MTPHPLGEAMNPLRKVWEWIDGWTLVTVQDWSILRQEGKWWRMSRNGKVMRTLCLLLLALGVASCGNPWWPAEYNGKVIWCKTRGAKIDSMKAECKDSLALEDVELK